MHFLTHAGDRAGDTQEHPQHSESVIPGVNNEKRGLSRSYASPSLSARSMSQPNDGQTSDHGRHSATQGPARSSAEPTPSLRSLPESTGGRADKVTTGRGSAWGAGSNTLGRKGSTRTARSTRTTGTISGATAAFTNGAAMTGPNAEPNVDESLFFRGANAERSLSQKQKDRINRDEKRENKRLSKLIKTESTSEKVALASALNTLAALQKLHKAAIKREAKAETSHAKALSAAQKAESRFHEAKARAAEERARAETRCAEEHARWYGKEAEVRAQQERMESERETLAEMEQRVAECAREVERLRVVKGTDEVCVYAVAAIYANLLAARKRSQDSRA
ncbi:hypothetical protein F5I97DRAFT_1889518, partial [Phlebopus sp. FC_14]